MLDDLVFQIKDGGNYLKINPTGLINYGSSKDWDRNWIRAVISVQGGVFKGKYDADLTTFDFENLKQNLNSVYDNLKGKIEFRDLEGYVNLKIVGNGAGNFMANVVCNDKPGINVAELKFDLSFDQTFIKDMVRSLNEITKQYPVVADF